MFYYIIFTILVFVSSLELVNIPYRIKRNTYIIFVIFFIVVSGLRWNTGNDWLQYSHFINTFDYDNPSSRSAFEPGLVQFARIITFFFGNNFTAYLLFLALFTIGLKSFFYSKNTSALLLALLLYWSILAFADISAIRQSLAVSICLISIFYIQKKNLLFFLLLVLLAMQFHSSAFIFFFAYPLYYAKWGVRTKIILLMLFITFFSLGLSSRFIDLFVKYFPEMGAITEKAKVYQKLGTGEAYHSGVSRDNQIILGLLKRAIIFPIILYFENKYFTKDRKFVGFSNIFLFGNLIYFLIGEFLSLQRLASYFYPLEVLLLCLIFEKVKAKGIWWLIFVLYSLVKVIISLKSAGTIRDTNVLDPYIWIFSENTYRKMF